MGKNKNPYVATLSGAVAGVRFHHEKMSFFSSVLLF
jgi:hypothetical protein